MLYFENEYIDLVQNTNASKTYVVLLNDKFVKVRHTAIKGYDDKKEVDAFVTRLINEVSVPEESVFMANMRKQWRDNSRL